MKRTRQKTNYSMSIVNLGKQPVHYEARQADPPLTASFLLYLFLVSLQLWLSLL
uniref:Uncharacterized protein n=1 Tax=Arundo donax TaxID=35708 RepID=A0A0A9FW47_ARUDO